jgi:hypothetical protein
MPEETLQPPVRQPLIEEVLGDLRDLHATFLRDAKAYSRQSGMKDGDRPRDSTAWQQCCANHAGVYRVAANEVSKLIKKYSRRMTAPPTNTPCPLPSASPSSASPTNSVTPVSTTAPCDTGT